MDEYEQLSINGKISLLKSENGRHLPHSQDRLTNLEKQSEARRLKSPSSTWADDYDAADHKQRGNKFRPDPQYECPPRGDVYPGMIQSEHPTKCIDPHTGSPTDHPSARRWFPPQSRNEEDYIDGMTRKKAIKRSRQWPQSMSAQLLRRISEKKRVKIRIYKTDEEKELDRHGSIIVAKDRFKRWADLWEKKIPIDSERLFDNKPVNQIISMGQVAISWIMDRCQDGNRWAMLIERINQQAIGE